MFHQENIRISDIDFLIFLTIRTTVTGYEFIFFKNLIVKNNFYF
jgi:hypothetical protein